MNTYSNITKEYLEGFECEEFKIIDGYYIGLQYAEKVKIDSIYEINGWKNTIAIDGVDGSIEISLAILDQSLSSDKIILDNMLTYCKYNKRKKILENL